MLEFQVQGMTCGGCAASVKRAVLTVDPAAEVEIDVPTKRARIDSRVDANRLAAAIADAGYTAKAI